MRRLLIGLYTLVCTGLFLLLLGAIYLALPDATDWTLDEARISALTPDELTNDYWQWHPSPDRELVALGRTEYLTHKTLFPKLIRPTWGYYIYARFQLRDQRLQDQLLSAVQGADRNTWPYKHERPGEPVPKWWHPQYSVALSHDDDQTFYFDPVEPNIAYTIRHYEGTSPD